MSSSEGAGAAGSPSPKMGVSGALGVLGVLLAVAALAINFVVPGPRGATGLAGADGQDGATGQPGGDGIDCWDLNGNGAPDLATEDRNLDLTVDVDDCTGPQGPSGPGTLMASDSAVGTLVPGSCFDVLTVFITPTVLGTIVVTASVSLTIEHTVGTPDLFDLYAGCTGTIVASELIPADLPTGSYGSTVAVQWIVSVGSPGTRAISAGIQMGAGASPGDQIGSLLLVAVFHPA